jgi:hypothetical protein
MKRSPGKRLQAEETPSAKALRWEVPPCLRLRRERSHYGYRVTRSSLKLSRPFGMFWGCGKGIQVYPNLPSWYR